MASLGTKFLAKVSSGKKFFHNTISGADFATQSIPPVTMSSWITALLPAEKIGQCTEDNYSYTSSEGTCKASSCDVELAPGSDMRYRNVSTDNEQILMLTVAQEPVSIAIEADQYLFQLCSSEVFTASCGTHLCRVLTMVVWPLVTEVKLAQTTGGEEFVG